MAKDYAKYVFKKPKRSKKSLRYYLSFVALTVFIFSLSVLTFFVVKHINKNPTFLAHFKHQAQKKSYATVMELKQEEPEIKFDFYDELPKTKIITQIKSPIQPVNVKPEKMTYALQFGKYETLNKAGELRISLLLMGIDANIMKTIDGFQVVSGSFDTENAAKIKQIKLQKKGVVSQVVKRLV